MSWIDQRPTMPWSAPSPPSRRIRCTVEPAAFREAMSRIGAAVHVITTDGPGGKTGFTATAVCSVSDEPPTLLVCLNRRSETNPIVQENGVFCVNTLGGGDELADIFAGRTGVARERFAAGDWTVLATGRPVLTTAMVAFDCRVVEMRSVASHNVIFGVVEAIRLGPAARRSSITGAPTNACEVE